MRSIVPGTICSVLVLLAACSHGGGDDSPNPPPPPTPQAQTITFATAGPVTKPLTDATYTNAASGGAGTGAISYSSSSTAVATVSSTGAVTFVAAGSVTITASKASDATHLAATANYTLTITAPPTPQPQTITFATAGPVSALLTAATYTNVASGGAGSGAITYSSSSTAVATVSSAGVVTFVTAGSVTITANKAADADYLAATASYELTITAPVVLQPQTIAFATAGPITRPIADGSYTNVASGGAGTGAITYQSSNTAVATVSATGVASFVAAGSVTISASKAADTNYLAATASYALTISPPPPPQPQTIAFANTGPVSRVLGDGSFTNAASGGAGTGAITYQSSNAAVATVAGAGVVTFVTTGQVTITANKAADAGYLAATANYTLTIATSAPVSFTGWMGAQDTQVTFATSSTNLEFLRSTQLDCNTALFTSCANNQSSLVGSSLLTDSAAHLTREANWWLRRGATVSAPTRISLQRFTPRTGPAVATFHGKLWMVGGQLNSLAFNSEVWSSEDGNSWKLVNGNAPFGVRDRAALAVFNDRLWLLGGEGSQFSTVDDLYKRDVWSSADGITWTQATARADWAGRFDHSAFAFNNRLWVLGGGAYPPYDADDEVWSSADGITWVAETTAAPFARGAMATVMNGRIWVVGGEDGSFTKEVYSSADGRTWRLETASAAYPGRVSGVFQAFNGRLYLLAGQTDLLEARANDVWSSADGITWVEETHSAPFAGRWQAGGAVFGNRLWIFGGNVRTAELTPSGFNLFYRNDAWSTTNGSVWKEVSPHVGFPAQLPQAVVWNSRMWIVGGYNGITAINGVWSSPDGGTWSAAAAGTSYPARDNTGVTVFNNELWVAGGSTFDGFDNIGQADVWHSADGANWTRSTNAAAFGARYGHGLVTLNGQMYVIGGFTTAAQNDVWRSSNGSAWTRIAAAAAFPARYGARATVFNNRLWLVGGTDGTSNLTDAWSSADGITWQLETANVPHLPESGFALTTHNGKLWVSGGYHPSAFSGDPLIYSDEIWSSTNGVTWTQVAAGPHYSSRRIGGLLSFDSKLWVLGGMDKDVPFNDVWSSADDGANWRMRYVGEIAYP